MEDVIYIRALAKNNGITSIVLGVAGLLFSAAILSWLPETLRLFGILICSGSLVAILIGWFKLREPAYSLAISRSDIIYKHRHGVWQLEWANVQRIDIPRVRKGLDQHDLTMVGIKIKDYQPLLDSLSPRLAIGILMEQRPLLLQSSQENCPSGTCYGDEMIEDNRFKTPEGKVYQGIKAMFAHRMAKLRERLGYDLYISASELDRDSSEFVQLMRQCQNERNL